MCRESSGRIRRPPSTIIVIRRQGRSRRSDQGPDQPARPRAGLFARRRLPCLAIAADPDAGRESDVARQPGGGDHQRHGGAGPGQYRPAGQQAGDGRQGLPVQEIRRHRRVRHRAGRDAIPTSSSTSSRRWSRRSAASTWKTSRRRSASTSRRKLARAHEDPGLPRRPARHGDHRRRRRSSTGWSWSARTSASVKLVASGAGAAAIACLDLLVALGLRRENILVTDIKGVVYAGRGEDMDDRRRRATRRTRHARTLAEIMPDADMFLGLSAGGVLKPDMVKAHGGRSPLILALANPEPEIRPGTRQGGAAGRHHRHRAARTIRTRSTTSCAFRSSSAARSTSARPRSTRR